MTISVLELAIAGERDLTFLVTDASSGDNAKQLSPFISLISAADFESDGLTVLRASKRASQASSRKKLISNRLAMEDNDFSVAARNKKMWNRVMSSHCLREGAQASEESRHRLPPSEGIPTIRRERACVWAYYQYDIFHASGPVAL